MNHFLCRSYEIRSYKAFVGFRTILTLVWKTKSGFTQNSRRMSPTEDSRKLNLIVTFMLLFLLYRHILGNTINLKMKWSQVININDNFSSEKTSPALHMMDFFHLLSLLLVTQEANKHKTDDLRYNRLQKWSCDVWFYLTTKNFTKLIFSSRCSRK